jgi:lycopene cyclase domain-containing protein
MVAARFEYLFLLGVFALVGLSILSRRAQEALRTTAFWMSLGIFVLFGTVIDTVAIRWNWWEWSELRSCGVRLFGIPIEEYILFVIGHATLVATWETLDDGADVA